MDGQHEEYERNGIVYTLIAFEDDGGFRSAWKCPICGSKEVCREVVQTAPFAVQVARAEVDGHHASEHGANTRRSR
jgi:hypothetical protein